MLLCFGHFELFGGFEKPSSLNGLAGTGDYSWFKSPGPGLIFEV